MAARQSERARLKAPTLSNFADVFDTSAYARVDDTTMVAVTDVIGSTDAIAGGQYKNVNLAGAAGIAALSNAAPDHDLAFAFGGDGAIVLLPLELEVEARRTLAGLNHVAERALGLKLRTALVPVSAIRARGRDVLLAYQPMAGGKTLAMLAGGGIALAESLAKSPEGIEFHTPPTPDVEPDLSGLSCRWQPLRPERGVMLSLVIAMEGPLEDYRPIFDAVVAASGGIVAPVSAAKARFSWPPRGLMTELKLDPQRQPTWRKVARILLVSGLGALSTWTGTTIGGFNGRRYRESLGPHSDYKKFADGLRMVIDCTREEAAAVIAYLEHQAQAGKLSFGAHMANAALLTCFVQSTDDGGHIHFVDGADGGYALAAQSLKRRAAQGT